MPDSDDPRTDVAIQEHFGSIILLTAFSTETAAHIRRVVDGAVPANRELFALDFPLKVTEETQDVRDSSGTLLGLRDPGTAVTNLDHHMERPEMRRRVSTVDLAAAYVLEHGPVTEDAIVIHHTDPDSVGSSVILAGCEAILGTDAVRKHPQIIEVLVKAGNSADHTGEENEIADLLGAIEEKRHYAYSIEQLQHLLLGEVLDPQAVELMRKRRAEREAARNFVEKGGLEDVGDGVMYARFDEDVRAEFFPSLLPHAKAFVLASPIGANLWQIKTRSGLALSPQVALNKLALPYTGGRWNATATKRSGGWQGENPRDYALMIKNKLSASSIAE